MTAAIGDDGIDPSHFLPEKTSIINKFRAEKGDLASVVETRTVGDAPVDIVVHAQVKDVSICADLIRRGFLEEHHRQYGYTLLSLRDAFSGRLTYKLNGVFVEGVFGDPVAMDASYAFGVRAGSTALERRPARSPERCEGECQYRRLRLASEGQSVRWWGRMSRRAERRTRCRQVRYFQERMFAGMYDQPAMVR